MKRSLMFILIMLLPGLARLYGQDVTVKAAFDTSRIFIGDQINFTVTVEQPSDIKLSLPLLRDTLTKNIEILSGPVTDSASVDRGKIRIREKYLVTSFDSGTYRLNPVFAEIKNESGIKRYYSDYTMLQVLRPQIAPPDTSMKIFDIVKPYNAPVTFGEILPWILGFLLAAVVVWLLVKYVGKLRKKKEVPSGPVIIEPAHVIAFRELERLKAENLWQKGETKKYYTRLTEILRQYLENRFGVYSMEMTTSETLEALVKTGFRKDESYNILKSVLTQADLVKFAKYKPEPSENETSYDNSWSFVTATRIEEVAAEPPINKDEKNKENA